MASYPKPARRRANREGSIYFVPSEDRWRAALTWTDEAGKRHRRAVSGKTQSAVRQRLGALRTDLDRGLAPIRTDTVAAFLAGWLERERQRVRASTWRGRDHHTRAYLVPALGTISLDKLTPAHVERMTADLVATGRSPRTASHARVTLRRALSDAVRDGLVHRNVAALARPPRVTRRTIEPGRDYLDAAHLRRLLAVAAEYRIGALVTVAATTGLRQGELLGLEWDDIDWQAGTLTVRRSLARAWDGGYELAAPKTGRSVRSVHLATATVEALRREEREQDAERQAAGSAWQDTDHLVFTDAVGRPHNPDTVRRAFHELLRAAGLPRVPFHGLRHSTATALLSAGVPLRVVSDLLGHSGIAITADYYAHVERDLRRDAADAMDRALGGGGVTRKRIASIPPWRSVAGYGEPGDLIERSVVPSAAYRARYVVRTLGRLDPWEVHRVTITDRETGAVATLPGAGSGGRLELVADHPPGYVERFWKDSLYLAGRARLGRPSGLTNVENDEQLYAVIRDMRTAGRRVTLPTVAANSTYTLSAIRNYLRLTGRKWVEFRGPR